MEIDYAWSEDTANPGIYDWSMDTVRVSIPAPTGTVGIAELDPDHDPANPESVSHKYLVYHYDHLGSVYAITDWGESSLYDEEFLADDHNGQESRYSVSVTPSTVSLGCRCVS